MGTGRKSEVQKSTALEYRTRVCRAMNFISQNLERDPSLDEIARSASFSKYHFHRVFKAVVGETIAEFTRRIRLELAANRLLVNPGDDITRIAISSGYSSSQNFATAFRAKYSMTPTEYRNSKIGNKVSNGENVLAAQTTYDPGMAFLNVQSNPGSQTMDAEVKDLPEQHVAYVRRMGPYGKETCEQAFGELMQWAGPRGHINSGQMLGVYWDNPEVTPPEKCRVDACITVPEGTAIVPPVGTQTISGGPHAVCHFEITGDSFQQAWEDAFAWLVGNGYECCDRPCFERYHNNASDHPEGKWIFDICIPLKNLA